VKRRRAREAIPRALALDPNRAETYATLASISTVYDWDWTAAERAVKRAIELAPGDGRPHQVYGAMLMATRRFDEAIEQTEAFRRLDPASAQAASNLARALYRAGQFDRATGVFHQAIALDPSLGPTYARLADVYIAQRRFDEAMAMLDKGQAVVGGTRRQTDGYGVLYAMSGRRREAEAVVAELTTRARTSDQVAYSIAMVETALGRHDQAMAWLERAYEQRSATLFMVNADQKLDALRADPRFQDLLKRMRFPPS